MKPRVTHFSNWEIDDNSTTKQTKIITTEWKCSSWWCRRCSKCSPNFRPFSYYGRWSTRSIFSLDLLGPQLLQHPLQLWSVVPHKRLTLCGKNEWQVGSDRAAPSMHLACCVTDSWMKSVWSQWGHGLMTPEECLLQSQVGWHFSDEKPDKSACTASFSSTDSILHPASIAPALRVVPECRWQLP